MVDAADGNAYRRRIRAWALYDVANSAFFLVVIATIFPPFYQSLYVQAHREPGIALEKAAEEKLRTQGASSLALTAGIAMAIVAGLGPILGAVSDRSASKKKFLAVFAGLGVLASGAMFLIGDGQTRLASILYAVGTIGVAGSIVFYDSLLPGIAREEDLDRVSSFGFAAGYLGSVLLLIANFLTITFHEKIGLEKGTAVRLSFLGVAVWWALFTIPILRRVPEPRPGNEGPGEGNLLLAGFVQLGRTFRKLGQFRQLLLFLVAFWIYSDGIGTIMKMATPFGYSLGVQEKDLMLALILTQIVGVPCAIAFGRLARRTGAKAGILIGLGAYAGICLGANFMSRTWHFYALAIAVGLVQGGTQALSRSLFASMIPKGQSGEFFGFFSAMEKFAGILGPLLLAYLWGGEDPDPRKGIMVLAAFFAVGALAMWRVDVEAGKAAARATPSAAPTPGAEPGAPAG